MLFRSLVPEEFERCLLCWLAALHDTSGGTLVAVDGKTLRRSFDRTTARSALPLVSAWAVSQRLDLGSVAVEQKSNEITAIPELLKLIELSGAIVTIDAMGCQAEIAGAIVAGGGNYILGVKGNQPTLHRGIAAFFLDHMDDDFARVEVSRHETKEEGHGRVEHRTYYVCDAPEGLADAGRWKGLAQIGMAISDAMQGEKSCDDVRYFILSRRMSARRFGTMLRGHRGIEIPQPEDSRRNNLCALGGTDYHRRRRPVGVGRVERQELSGSRRHFMLNTDSICVPPRPRLLHRTR